jgi:hypothetical protein
MAATKNSTAETIADFLINNIITRHGVMKYLISDRAQSFVSRIINNLSQRIGFTHITTTSFHPQSNISERVNASIANMLSHYCSSTHKDWDLQLSSITLALNTQYHQATRSTPYYLLYGRQCNLPGDIPAIDQSENERVNRWKTAQKLAEKYIGLSQRINKSYYDKKRQDMRFNVGDQVMLYSPNRKVGRATKLLHLWNGPYKVIRVKTPLVYELQLTPNRTDVVHISRMKKYHERATANTTSSDIADSPVPASLTPRRSMRLRNQRRHCQVNGIMTIALMVLMFIMMIGNIQMFDTIEPIQWSLTDRVVINKVQPYQLKVEFHSPCTVFNNLQYTHDGLMKWCNNLFEESFVNPFIERCSTHEFRREKRVAVVPVIIAIAAVTTIVSGIVGISVKKTQRRLDHLMEELENIHKLVSQGQEADKHIKNALRIAGMEINRTQLIAMANNHELHTDVAIATYLTYRFAEIKMRTLISSDSENKFKLTTDLLEILNTSLPCGEKCPLDCTSLINCNIDVKRNQVSMAILSREPSRNLIILKSEPFTLYNTNGIEKCHTSYSGPESLVFDKKSNCTQPLPTFDSSKFVEFSHKNLNCSNTNFHNIVWNITECSVENTFDDIQIKYGINYNYIYCYESNITIAGKILPCPNKPFKLRSTTSFLINDFEYSMSNMQYLNLSTKDYMWSQLINNYLVNITPFNVSTDELFDEINKIKLDDIFREHKHTITFSIIILLISLTVIIVVITCLIYRLKTYRRTRHNVEQIQSQIVYEAARQLVSTLITPRYRPPLSNVHIEEITE